MEDRLSYQFEQWHEGEVELNNYVAFVYEKSDKMNKAYNKGKHRK